MTPLLILLWLQALLGAADVLWNHELKEKLPQRPSARREQWLHGVRELLYAVVFAGIAWLEWRGLWAGVFAAVLLIEVWLTALDFIEEDRHRLLGPTERVMHLLLAMGGGAYVALLVPVMSDWAGQPTALQPVNYGWLSPALSLAAVGVLAWGVRDLLARPQAVVSNLDFGPRHQRLLITGGTGFIGTRLVEALLAEGHDLTLLTRQPLPTAVRFRGAVRAISDLEQLSSGERFDAVINLAGAPVLGPRWTVKRRRELLASRVGLTEKLGAWLARCETPPPLLINASAIGYYGARDATPLDEAAGPQAEFMSELCQRWESAAQQAAGPHTRLVIFRLGVVLGEAGALPMMMLPHRFRVGGTLGDGRQYLSWVGIDDVLGALALALRDPTMAGIYNLTAPEPLPQREFAHELARACGGRAWLTLPASVVRLMLGEAATLLIDGQRVLPRRLLAHGYEFVTPTLAACLERR
ncbi:TIGR01777 family oxidoreductase [Chitinimonas lacunae]|uniref:TIGR01777 family oxidoreductase n=1 Tax=Chitinimonas lacunae TaxID=1963018 RepID=A0ABV8MN17_9NEIS